MHSLRTLLLATDFGPASQAASIVTARLAHHFGSLVTPLHIVDVDSDSALVDFYRRQVGQRMMEPLLTMLTQENVEVAHPVVLTGPVVDQILRKADEMDADLIVIGTGEPGDDGTASPGSIAEAVIQQARQPVLVVRPGNAPGFRHILCPFDGSSTSLRGLKNAIRLAEVFQAQLTVLSVVPEVDWMTAAAEVGMLTDVHRQYADQRKESVLDALRKLDFGNVSWSADFHSGSPAKEILAVAAKKQIDLIVMGATGRSGVTYILLGSTTRRIMRKLPCSLLVVHDEDALLEDLNAEDVQTNNLAYAEANALLAEQSYEPALRKFDQVLARNPFHVPALEGRAKACEALGQYERATRCRRRAEILRHETWA